MQKEQQTMVPTMATNISPENAHKNIPGNPSTAKSSSQKLNDRSNGKALRILSEEDWVYWVHNDFIVIKNVRRKIRMILKPGMLSQGQK
jgi:hypothetical protein